MKQQLAILLIVSLLLTFASCTQESVDGSTSETTTEALSTTDNSTVTTTDPYVPHATETTWSVTTENKAEIPTMPFVDEFESFMQVGDFDMYANTVMTLTPESGWTLFPSMCFFEVVGIHEIQGIYTVYNIRFTEVYGYNPFDMESVYRMAWLGTASQQMYGRPPLEIGKTYVRISDFLRRPFPLTAIFQAGMCYGVQEIDGARYLYGYGVDLSEMECKIEITDPEENCPYQKGKHDKAIAYLESIGQPLPSFDYKCEVEAFWREFERRCS